MQVTRCTRLARKPSNHSNMCPPIAEAGHLSLTGLRHGARARGPAGRGATGPEMLTLSPVLDEMEHREVLASAIGPRFP
jgi:hypothetical protein